jgi:hypothetical protein
MPIASAITKPTSRWHCAAWGSVDASAVMTASDSSGSASMARVARRSTSMTRSDSAAWRGGRECTRRDRSRTQSTSASASRWSFEEKYR